MFEAEHNAEVMVMCGGFTTSSKSAAVAGAANLPAKRKPEAAGGAAAAGPPPKRFKATGAAAAGPPPKRFKAGRSLRRTIWAEVQAEKEMRNAREGNAREVQRIKEARRLGLRMEPEEDDLGKVAMELKRTTVTQASKLAEKKPVVTTENAYRRGERKVGRHSNQNISWTALVDLFETHTVDCIYSAPVPKWVRDWKPTDGSKPLFWCWCCKGIYDCWWTLQSNLNGKKHWPMRLKYMGVAGRSAGPGSTETDDEEEDDTENYRNEDEDGQDMDQGEGEPELDDEGEWDGEGEEDGEWDGEWDDEG